MGKNHDALTPPTGDGTIPNHTIESPTTGAIAIDQSAIVPNPKTCREIFEDGMQSGLFNDCKNCSQVNNKIAAIRNNGKPAPYMVSEIAHAWTRTETGWVKRSDAELAADPFVPGVRGERASYKGRLADVDLVALQAQEKALKTLTGDLAVSVAPLLKEIGERLANHETAVQMEAINQVAIKRRTLILENVKTAMQNHEKAGFNYPLTLTLNFDGTVVRV
jgi:hypothetical protein